MLKLQESPESVPQGEMPRHMQLFCDRYLCDRVVPGNRVTVMGIFSIKKSGKPSKVGNSWKNLVVLSDWFYNFNCLRKVIQIIYSQSTFIV